MTRRGDSQLINHFFGRWFEFQINGDHTTKMIIERPKSRKIRGSGEGGPYSGSIEHGFVVEVKKCGFASILVKLFIFMVVAWPCCSCRESFNLGDRVQRPGLRERSSNHQKVKSV